MEPGEHEFSILSAKSVISFEAKNKKEITVTSTLNEGYYELVDTGTSVTFQRID